MERGLARRSQEFAGWASLDVRAWIAQERVLPRTIADHLLFACDARSRGRDALQERVPTIPSASPHQTVKPRGLFAEARSIRPRNGSNSRLPGPTNDYFGQQ